MSRPGYWLALCSVLLGSAAQLLLKLGIDWLPPLAELGQPALWLQLEPRAVLCVGLGLLLYAVSMLIWVWVLTHLPLSRAYPLLSLSYVVVYLVATQFPLWGEVASDRRGLGIVLIALGVLLVSRPERVRPLPPGRDAGG